MFKIFLRGESVKKNKKNRVLLAVLASIMLTACGEKDTNTNTTAQEEPASSDYVGSSSIQRRYIDGLPVYDAWEKDLSELNELKENTPDLSLDAFGFMGYKLDPYEAIEQDIAELTLDLRNNIEGMQITYIGNEDNLILWDSDELINTNVVDSTLYSVEDIQYELLSMVDEEEQKDDYDGYFNGLIFLTNEKNSGDGNGSIEIHLQIQDGCIIHKSLEFSGAVSNPVSYYFSSFILNETEAQIFDVDCEENPEVIKDHSNDNLYPLNYDLEVLKQYGVETTVDEIQWEGEVGNSDLRMQLTITSHLKEDMLVQTRDDLVLNSNGERINTFLAISEHIPAGESKTIDVTILNLNEEISSIEMKFHYGIGVCVIETSTLRISDFTNESPTITFDNKMADVNDDFMTFIAE